MGVKKHDCYAKIPLIQTRSNAFLNLHAPCKSMKKKKIHIPSLDFCSSTATKETNSDRHVEMQNPKRGSALRQSVYF